ncbi:MAG: SDR family oxidoreductase [Promethearchaeota archaeon]
MSKILIIGANGFLGTNILQFRNNFDFKDQNISFVAADLENSYIPREIPFFHINITNPEDLFKKIIKISPDIVILTAAMTDVDKNEELKELASKINTEAPINIMKTCKQTDSKLVFLSTDFVFDGFSKEGNYDERDEPNPINHYGKTKYEAEQAIINSEIEFLICRTAVLYGWNKRKLNFITWILNKLQNNEKITIVTNQINNATFVRNLAQILLKLIEKDTKGIYHTVGDGALSRFEMALKCAQIFNLDEALIIPIDHFKQKAKRPKNAGLNISKLKKLIGSELKIFSLDDGLKYMKKNMTD